MKQTKQPHQRNTTTATAAAAITPPVQEDLEDIRISDHNSPDLLKPIEYMDNESLTRSAMKHKSTVSVFFLVLTISFGSLFFGYSIGVLTLAQDTIWAVFQVSSSDQDTYSSILNATVPLGAMIGSISAGKLLDVVSRRDAFIIADIIGIAAALIGQIVNINVFIVSRFLVGAVTGLNSALVPQYIQEVAPLQISGQMGTVFQICVNAGIIIANLFGQFFPETPLSSDSYWRYVFLFPLVLTVGRIILIMLFYNHDTPFYYLLVKDKKSAIKFLTNMYHEEHVEEICDAIQVQVDKVSSSTEAYSDMWKPNMINRLFIACTLQLIQQFSGINAVIMYSGQIFKQNGYSFTLKNLLTLISNTVLLFSALASGLVLNSFGRKKILVVGTLVSGIFLAVLAILNIIDDSSLSFLSVVCIFSYYLAFNFSLGPIVWLYCSEILPGKGISIATMFNWTGATIMVFLVPYLSLTVLFICYASVCFGGMFFMMTFMRETKDKTKAEISQMFAKKGDDNSVSSIDKDDD